MNENDEIKDKVESDLYKCKSCGGNLLFDPDSASLKCERCDAIYPINDVKQVMEMPYDEDTENGFVSWENTKIFKCDNCGAEVVLSSYSTSQKCPFCGADHIVQLNQIPGLQPNGILPFVISKEKATNLFRAWAKKRKFAPRDFIKQATTTYMNGIYVPSFTFDTNAIGAYRIRYGEYYYVTVTNSKGESHQERRTRWYEDAGKYNRKFDDIQVEASRYLTQNQLSKLGHFDTNNAYQFKSEFISGFASERYGQGLDASWSVARGIAEATLKDEIGRSYHADVIDYVKLNGNFIDNTYKYVLLPIYVIKYAYKKKDYGCLVNGREGTLTGKAPVSVGKVLLLVFFILLVVGGIIAVVVLFGDDSSTEFSFDFAKLLLQ